MSVEAEYRRVASLPADAARSLPFVAYHDATYLVEFVHKRDAPFGYWAGSSGGSS